MDRATTGVRATVGTKRKGEAALCARSVPKMGPEGVSGSRLSGALPVPGFEPDWHTGEPNRAEGVGPRADSQPKTQEQGPHVQTARDQEVA